MATIIHYAGATKGDELATQNLVDAATRAGRPHLVYISVVGAARMPVSGRIDRRSLRVGSGSSLPEVDSRRRAVAWVKDDPFGVEFAELQLSPGRLTAAGVAIGSRPVPYRLDYALATSPGFVTSLLRVSSVGEGWRRSLQLERDEAGIWSVAADEEGDVELPPAGGDPLNLANALDCDLGLSPVTNLLPILRNDLLSRGGSVELTAAWVSVPDLGVQADGQRYIILRRRPISGSSATRRRTGRSRPTSPSTATGSPSTTPALPGGSSGAAPTPGVRRVMRLSCARTRMASATRCTETAERLASCKRGSNSCVMQAGRGGSATELAAAPSGVGVRERDLEEHRAELTGFCYRMLGSPFEAEDAAQETLVRAWRALERFEGRSTLRSWLFGIATNVCIDMLKARRRRALPMELGPPSPGDGPLGAALPEHLWVGPVLDDRVLPANGDPAEVAVARESIRLAFVVALQRLTPKQRAAVILRDVLRWKVKEVARLLDTTTVSVESLVRRARAVLADADTGAVSALDGDAAVALVDRYAEAFERYDVDALVALLHEDVTLSMPPNPLWLRGVDAVRTFFGTGTDLCRGARFLPVAANGAPGLAFYKPTGPGGRFEAFGIKVIEQSEGKIIGIHAFLDPRLFALFGVPLTLAR